MRYPRGQGPGVADRSDDARACRSARRKCGAKAAAALRSSRSARWSPPCERIAEKLDATLVNLRFVKPLDEELIVRIAATIARS